jgi:hypothetical protein
LLGDLIDYGMHSNEVVEMIRQIPWPVLANIRGNHEAAIFSDQRDRFSSDRGRQSSAYTESILSEASRQYILQEMQSGGKHEFTVDGKQCLAVHGSLADEYWNGTSYSTSTTIKSHDWTVPAGLNVSGSYDNVPWQEDLLDNMAMLSSIDSRYPDRIGRFQGGDTYPLNRWRSEKISCMIDNRQYFSAWQRDLIVRRIFSLAGETFSFSDFIASDVTVDPVREGTSGAPRLGRIPEAGAYHICPPLPPPVPHED